MMNENRFRTLAKIKTDNSKLLNEVNRTVRNSSIFSEAFDARSKSKDFDTFFMEHRSLLVRAIRKYPNQLNENDLEAFDNIVSKSRSVMRQAGILKEWRSVVSFNKPEDYLTANSDNIMLEAYLGPNYKNILMERAGGTGISEEELKGINAAMKTQVDAINALRKWYKALSKEDQDEANRLAQEKGMVKSRKNFDQELDDLETEIAGIYGKLENSESNVVSRIAKKGFGFFQRGMSGLFGAGKVTDSGTTTKSDKTLDENANYNLNEASAAGDMANAVAQWFASNPNAITMPDRIARKFGNIDDVADVIHRLGRNISGAHGHLTQVADKMAGYIPQAIDREPSLMPNIKPDLGHNPPMSIDPSQYITGAAGLSNTAILGWAAAALAVAALVTAGAAGVKLGHRRQRIEALQMIAREIHPNIKMKSPIENKKAETVTQAAANAALKDVEKAKEKIGIPPESSRVTGYKEPLGKAGPKSSHETGFDEPIDDIDDRRTMKRELAKIHSVSPADIDDDDQSSFHNFGLEEAVFNSRRFAKLAGLLKD